MNRGTRINFEEGEAKRMMIVGYLGDNGPTPVSTLAIVLGCTKESIRGNLGRLQREGIAKITSDRPRIWGLV
jgi:DNA-binding Lrp family transcriptional regulator